MATRTAKTAKTAATAKTPAGAAGGRILVGVGGWTFEPWRDNFYPRGLTQARELEFASRALTAIEINGTYYRLQSRASFAKWHSDTPDGFVFSLKASRYSTNRRVLAEAGESIEKYFASGIAELGDKLGPIVWQFATSKQFDAADFGAFLALLPAKVEGVPVRHAMEVRHDSFKCAEYLALARRFNVATVYTDSDEYPSIADSTGDFVYARLMNAQADNPTGYAPTAIDGWASAARTWVGGGHPEGLPELIAPRDTGGSNNAPRPRDVFVYFINGAKERAPAAAMALIQRLGGTSGKRLSL